MAKKPIGETVTKSPMRQMEDARAEEQQQLPLSPGKKAWQTRQANQKARREAVEDKINAKLAATAKVVQDQIDKVVDAAHKGDAAGPIVGLRQKAAKPYKGHRASSGLTHFEHMCLLALVQTYGGESIAALALEMGKIGGNGND